MLSLRPVLVETGCPDEQGRLVFHGERLVAVLVRLSDQHGDMAGRWYLEHGFGRLDDGPVRPCFEGLDAARDWIARRLGHAAVGPR